MIIPEDPLAITHLHRYPMKSMNQGIIEHCQFYCTICQLHKAQKADDKQMVSLAVCRESEYCPLHNEWKEPFNNPFGTESRIPNIIVS